MFDRMHENEEDQKRFEVQMKAASEDGKTLATVLITSIHAEEKMRKERENRSFFPRFAEWLAGK